jgi:hypothetical protein
MFHNISKEDPIKGEIQMKKIISAALSAALCMSLAGCAESEQSVYQKAYDQAFNSSSVTSSITMDMTVEVSGQTMEMPITMDMKMIDFNDASKVSGDIKMTMELLGQQTDIEMWIKDQEAYIDSDGTKSVEYFDNSEASASLMMQKYEDYDKVQMKKNGSDYDLTCTLKSDKADELYKKILSSAGSSASTDLSGMDVSVGDIAFVIDKDHNMKSISYTLTASGEVSSMDVTYVYDVKGEYSDWNSTSVDFPDLANWETQTN